jgi:hypothetical protein
MSAEPIPGMAEKIRETLRRRCGGTLSMMDKIDRLKDEDIYSAAPSDAVSAIVSAEPVDRSDIKQWMVYKRVAERELDQKRMNEWIRTVQEKYGLSIKKKAGAA